MSHSTKRWFSLMAVLMLALSLMSLAGKTTYAQGDTRTFPETGHTVSGLFLAYWDSHGGLAQQGYPLTEASNEVSPVDGKTYLTQYFERAVFEAHPENAAPYDVLLSLLGSLRYNSKYAGGAPDQTANTEADAVKFPETNHTVGGKFLAYWNSHGGLAQQGYPISEQFTEVSDVDGKPYTVQYFERAVFEMHPENAAPNDVLALPARQVRLLPEPKHSRIRPGRHYPCGHMGVRHGARIWNGLIAGFKKLYPDQN